jgi:DNA-binding CsgD family transcriptional regulator
MGGDAGPMAEYRDEMHAAVAEALGLSVEEFEAALAEGKTPQQIAEEQGIAQEEFCADLHGAAEGILAQAVSDGAITQEQADWILERMNDRCLEGGGPMRGGRGHGPGWMAEYRYEMHAAVAEALGMSVEEFETALAEGKTPQQIAEEQGITQEEFCADLHDAAEEILAQAVSDGAITQEQADWALDHVDARCEAGGGPTGCGWGHAPPAE